MIGKSKIVIAVSGILIGIVSVLVMYFVLMSAGLVGGNSDLNTIVFATESMEKIYDGDALTCEKYSITKGSLEPGHSFDVSFTGSQTEVGQSNNNLSVTIKDENGKDVTTKYTVKYELGTLSVKQRPITIDSLSASKKYDGEPLMFKEYLLTSGNLVKGHELELEFTSSITNAGTQNNTFNAMVFDESGKDVTKNYSISKNEGILEVLPRTITVQTEGGSKYYDGTPLTNSNCVVDSTDLLSTHKMEVNAIGSITEVGKMVNGSVVIIKDENGNDVADNYLIEKVEGELEVLPRPITIITSGASKYYDGTPLTNPDYTIESQELLDGHTLDVKTIGAITNVGTVENDMIATIKDSQGNLITNNYEIIVNKGTLEVLPRKIVVSTGSATKYYDGTPLTCSDYELVVPDLLSSHTIDVVAYGTITDAGIESNSARVIIKDAEGNEVTGNYDVTVTEGKLEVVRLPITITSGSASKNYDGKALTCNEFEVTGTNQVVEGQKLDVQITGSRTEPGENKNIISSAVVLDKDNNDVTYNYEVTTVLGTLTVKLADGSTSDGGSGEGSGGGSGGGSGSGSGEGSGGSGINLSKQPFGEDNTEYMELYSTVDASVYLRCDSYGDYTYAGWSKGFNDFDFSSSVVNPMYLSSKALQNSGSTENSITIKMLVEGMGYHIPYYTTNGPSNSNDYMFNYSYENPYTLNYISYDYLSDGKVTIGSTYSAFEEEYYQYVVQHYLALPETTKQAMLTIIADNSINKDSSTIIADVAEYIQNAAVYNLKFEAFPNNVDMAIYFLTTAKEGICQHYATSAVVMFRALGIPARYTTGFVGNTVANETTKVTGMQAHAWVEVYIKGMGWVPVEVTGSGPNGGGANSGGGSGGGSNNPLEKKYTVKPVSVYKLYDGSTIYAKQEVQGISALLEKGYTYEVEIIGENSTVGIVKSLIKSFTLYDDKLNDVTDQFNFSFEPGILQNYLYEISVSSEGAEKTYDGTVLSNFEWEYDGNIADGHYIDTSSITFVQQPIDVGEYVNVVKFAIYDNNGEDVTNEYRIYENFGALVINARTLTIISASESKKFDGKVLKCNEYTLGENSSVVEGETINVTITGYQKLPGKSENKIASVVILNAKGEDVSKNYIITTINGTLEVTLK